MSESATIKLPAVGEVKRNHLYVGLAAVAGILGYAWWRARGAAGAPVEDVAAEPGFDDYGGVQGGGSGGSSTPGIPWQPAEPGDPDDLPPTTNAVWTQRAVDYMQGLGYDGQLVATVLGKYLGRVPVVASEADIIRTVLGAIGQPPVGEYRIIMVGTPPTNPPPTNPPPTKPPPTTPTPTPSYYAVTVVKFTSGNPPWNSTVSGIASHYGKSWTAVWNDAKNAPLRAKRGKPELIRAGDIVYVRK